jgi:hypothetical protein
MDHHNMIKNPKAKPKLKDWSGLFIAIIALVIVGILFNNKIESKNDSGNTGKKEKHTEQKSLKIVYFPAGDVEAKMVMDSCFNTLKNKCIYVKNYVNLSDSIVMHYDTSNLDYRAERYGWKKQILIEMYVKRDYNTVPPDMAGQTLFYYIGAGKKPGIVINKWQAMQLCGLNQTNIGEDVHIPIDDVSFIK